MCSFRGEPGCVFGWIALLSLVLPFVPAVAAPDDAGIARLVKQLGDDDFDQREAASKALTKVGEPALEVLRKAAASSGDVEVRHRAGQLIEAIENDLPYLFNGKDLTGWVGLKYWSVKDGAIVGDTSPDGVAFNTFLCSKKKYKDFELTFKVRLKGGTGNSGVQIRSAIFDQIKLAVAGPQCDIAIGYWGSLYGEALPAVGMMKAAPKDVVEKVLKKADFNDFYIKCVGKHVTVKLNGATTVDDDFEKMADEGIIAWQIHGGGAMEVTFKAIQFKDLSRK